jgi:ribosomal protein S18 acetylase RimI-like enzyme
MFQSSITAWLKKPTSVVRADTPTELTTAPAVIPAESLDEPPIVVEHSTPEDSLSQDEAVTVSNAFTLPSLPANVEFAPLTEDLIPSFKRLLSLTLPVAYPAVFFTETMTEPHHSITLMALWHVSPPGQDSSSGSGKPRLVGAVRCRLLPSANLYISTISLLSPYRSHGIATHLLQRIAVKASEEHGVKYITAHVWEANEDGLEWYKKRGFEIIGTEERYYGKLKPSGAVLVRKVIGIGDYLNAAKTAGEPGR